MVAVCRHTAYDLRDLTVTDADGRGQTLQLTPGHKVYIVGLGWTEAGQVTAGEHMVLADGSEAVVTANVDDARPDGVTVYNFQVEGDHTYFVSTFASAYADGAVVAADDALWVHNSCADVLRRNRRKAGSYGPGSDVPHHIVDRGAYSGRAANVQAALEKSKDVLARAGFTSLDEHWNGALLSKSSHTVSTNKYILTVSGRLVAAEARALAAGQTEKTWAAHLIPTNGFSNRTQEVVDAIRDSQKQFDKYLGAAKRNSAVNGFFTDSARHLGTHTNAFFLEMGNLMRAAKSGSDVTKALARLKALAKARQF